jgi:hypothetical protein
MFFIKKNRIGVISASSLRKRKTTGITVLCLTTIFLLMTLPQAFIRGFFLTSLSSYTSGISIIFATDAIASSFHGLSFFLLIFSNKKFSNEIKKVIFCATKHKNVETTELPTCKLK